MTNYKVAKTTYFRALGYKVQAGQDVELTDEQAKEVIDNDPTLLATARLNTQSEAKQVRTPAKKKTTTKK